MTADMMKLMAGLGIGAMLRENPRLDLRVREACNLVLFAEDLELFVDTVDEEVFEERIEAFVADFLKPYKKDAK